MRSTSISCFRKLVVPLSIFSQRIITHKSILSSIPIEEMCKGVDNDSSPLNTEGKIPKRPALFPNNNHHLTKIQSLIPAISGGFLQGPYTKKKILLLLIISSLLLGTVAFASLYQFNTGFRRTVQFWRGMGPMAIEYKVLKLKAKRWDKLSEEDEEYKKRISAYREVTAPKVVDLILKLGGIYIKIGQVMSTIGAGILPEEYIDALRPLQDGVPPRDIKDIRHIIESSSKKKMNDIFEEFDEVPIGAASIAQVHRARLRPVNGKDSGEEVVVKVQYPEIEEMLEADLRNMELVTRWLAPENLEVAKSLRKRHENELDFRIEASNIRECTSNMQAYGVEPSLVRIPRVRNETGLCNKNVLIMEYLEGTSLSDVILMEQDRMARAMGKEDAQELRKVLAQRMRDHFENGGGEQSDDIAQGTGKPMFDLKNTAMKAFSPDKLAGAFRFYVQVKTKVDGLLSVFRPNHQNEKNKGNNKQPKQFNLKPILKTLVHVHGLQILKDGVYNADPHPGNVLVLPDGRLGLLDYGMVGRLSNDQRYSMSSAILGLYHQNKTQVADLYQSSGYAATMSNENITDVNILHRFATFHLDKIDLSPLVLENGDTIEIMDLMKNARERVIPPWVEEGRRLGGLLQGVCAQAARPISLAKEWKGIASQVVIQTKK